MKIGVIGGFSALLDGELVAATGEIAEQRGLHQLWVPEHVLLFDQYESRYPYSEDGKMPGDNSGLLEAFTVMTWIAARTRRLRIGTGICIIPQRNPVYTAKQVADLDHLSGGRVDLGVGLGWLREEFEGLGVPFEQRGARTDEYLELMKRLWMDKRPEFTGRFHQLAPCIFEPKPVQRPHPPIIVGGQSRAAFQRVAKHGQGWYGHDLGPEDLPPLLRELDDALAEQGRKPGDVQRIVSPLFRPVDVDMAKRYQDQGVDQITCVMVAGDTDGLKQRADELAKLVEAVS